MGILDQIKMTLSGVDILAVAVFAMCFVAFFIFFVLGLYLFKMRYVPSLMFFISFCFLLITPFAIMLSSRDFFYKIEIVKDNSRPLQFSKAFSMDFEFKNVGKMPITHCIAGLYEKNASHNLKERIKDLITPILQHKIHADIPINATYKVSAMLDYDIGKRAYYMILDCR